MPISLNETIKNIFDSLNSMERQKYYKHIQKAKNYPEKYMSIIIDGMDQSKTEIPHYMYISSMVSSLWKLRVHLAGKTLEIIDFFL